MDEKMVIVSSLLVIAIVMLLTASMLCTGRCDSFAGCQQFDPQIVEVFVRIYPKFLEIGNENNL